MAIIGVGSIEQFEGRGEFEHSLEELNDDVPVLGSELVAELHDGVLDGGEGELGEHFVLVLDAVLEELEEVGQEVPEAVEVLLEEVGDVVEALLAGVLEPVVLAGGRLLLGRVHPQLEAELDLVEERPQHHLEHDPPEVLGEGVPVLLQQVEQRVQRVLLDLGPLVACQRRQHS